MENEEMTLRIKRLNDERTSTVGYGDVADGDKKMPAVEQPDNDKGLDVEKQQPVTVGVITDNEDICNYPDCLFVNGGPPLDVCQGFCGGRSCFHPACKVNWLESKILMQNLANYVIIVSTLNTGMFECYWHCMFLFVIISLISD